ncbi:MAG: DUF5302 domain-containing protein [Mycobacterium sp.]
MANSDSDPQDETRRKFREALERKQDKAAGAAARAEAAGKQSKAHGPVGGRRTFRRKSGG